MRCHGSQLPQLRTNPKYLSASHMQHSARQTTTWSLYAAVLNYISRSRDQMEDFAISFCKLSTTLLWHPPLPPLAPKHTSQQSLKPSATPAHSNKHHKQYLHRRLQQPLGHTHE